jgi:hypothetical protein
MANPEGLKNREAEESPEDVSKKAVSAIENKDAADPVISSEWATRAKKYGKGTAITIGAAIGLSLFIVYRVTKSTYQFAKTAIEKRGKMTFADGYKIGKEMFPFFSSDKKDKK